VLSEALAARVSTGRFGSSELSGQAATDSSPAIGIGYKQLYFFLVV